LKTNIINENALKGNCLQSNLNYLATVEAVRTVLGNKGSGSSLAHQSLWGSGGSLAHLSLNLVHFI